jgi:hypothetical protein
VSSNPHALLIRCPVKSKKVDLRHPVEPSMRRRVPKPNTRGVGRTNEPRRHRVTLHEQHAPPSAGVIALGLDGFVATFQPDPHFSRTSAWLSMTATVGAWRGEGGSVSTRITPSSHPRAGATSMAVVADRTDRPPAEIEGTPCRPSR